MYTQFEILGIRGSVSIGLDVSEREFTKEDVKSKAEMWKDYDPFIVNQLEYLHEHDDIPKVTELSRYTRKELLNIK